MCRTDAEVKSVPMGIIHPPRQNFFQETGAVSGANTARRWFLGQPLSVPLVGHGFAREGQHGQARRWAELGGNGQKRAARRPAVVDDALPPAQKMPQRPGPFGGTGVGYPRAIAESPTVGFVGHGQAGFCGRIGGFVHQRQVFVDREPIAARVRIDEQRPGSAHPARCCRNDAPEAPIGSPRAWCWWATRSAGASLTARYYSVDSSGPTPKGGWCDTLKFGFRNGGKPPGRPRP